MNSILSLTLMCLFGCARVAVGQQTCKPLGTAAADGGLNILGQAVAMAAKSLETTDTGMAVLGAVSASGAVPEDMRVTVFAPSDAAFQAALQALSSQDGAAVTPGAEELAAVLLNHVVPGDLTSTAIKAVLGEAGGSTIVPTLLGSDLFVSTVDEGLYVQSRGLEAPGALVVTPDIPTCVGPVHVIDKVLFPADADDMIVMFSGEPAAEFETETGGDVQPEDGGEDATNGEGAEGSAAPTLAQPAASAGAYVSIWSVGMGTVIAAVALTM